MVFPQCFKGIIFKHAQKLDELDELQRGIFVDLLNVVVLQVVQGLSNLLGKKLPLCSGHKK